MAQLVEQRFRKAWVVGSSPTFGSAFISLQISNLQALFTIVLFCTYLRGI